MIEKHFGQVIKYNRQSFIVGEASSLGGVYVKAISEGKCPVNDSQWLSDRAFKKALKGAN